MQFLNPHFLWLLLLGLIPVALYLFRRKSKMVSVSTLGFFKTLAKEHQESAWLRHIKKWISFVLTILMLCLPVFVIARFISTQDDSDHYRSIVILLDRSASMAVEDPDGETRLDTAKRILRSRLERVPEEVGVALIAYDARPEVVQPRTLSRRELISRLEGVEIRPVASRPDLAMESAIILGGLEKPGAIWHASDRSLGSVSEDSEVDSDGNPKVDSEMVLPDSLSLRELNVALDSVTNPGITAFRLRPVALEHSRYEAYVQVALNAAAPDPVTTRIEVSVGGIPSQFREIDLEPGERAGITFQVNGVSRQTLKIELKTDRDDFLEDNRVMVSLPESRPVLAAWIRPNETEDPYTRFALSSIQESGSFELLKGSPEAWPLNEEVDAVIFDGWLPETWPDHLPAIVINPPGSSGPILAQALKSPIPYDEVRVGNENHPVLFRVSSSRVAITQTAVFQSSGSLEPLWIAGNEPVLAAGEVNGRRIVLMGFSPGLSDRLPLTASFPLLMGNALLWCVERETEAASMPLYSTGELVSVEGESITWKEWKGRDEKTSKKPIRSDVLEMDRLGLWETDTGQRGASFILSSAESDIRARPEAANNDYFVSGVNVSRNLKPWLLGGLVILLLLESWLFHRFAVY